MIGSSSLHTPMSTSINGSTRELFRQKSAALFLLDYDEQQTLSYLRMGVFAVNLIVQKSSPILIVTCVLDGILQWPITKDSPVIRVGKRSFAFAMPGLLYGLQFPIASCGEDMMDSLERVFMKFAYYKDLKKEDGYPWADNERNLWSKSRPKIESVAHKTLFDFGKVAGKSPSAVGNQTSGFLRAMRTSATTKMVSNAVLSGSLNPAHIEIEDMRPQQKRDDTNIIFQLAFPSISVFSNLIEAVETFWVIASGDSHLLKEKNAADVKQLVGFKIWKLKREGMVAFLERLKCK